MIEILRQMVLGVTAAAIFSAAMMQFSHKSAISEIVRLGTGMVLILALLTPLTHLSLPSFSGWFAQAHDAVERQTEQAQVRNTEIAHSGIASAVGGFLTDEARKEGIACIVRASMATGADGTAELSDIEVRGKLTVPERTAMTELVTKNCGVAREHIIFMED
ncbi:MAG: hypothetical protein EOM63_03140 [Clostridia bacterium]|nr:hypothetical protein [Clostridia bacterium]